VAYLTSGGRAHFRRRLPGRADSPAGAARARVCSTVSCARRDGRRERSPGTAGDARAGGVDELRRGAGRSRALRAHTLSHPILTRSRRTRPSARSSGQTQSSVSSGGRQDLLPGRVPLSA
jgi:hypothetical protein